MPPSNELEAIEMRLLLDAIRARYGYDLRGYADRTLQRRMQSALVKSGFQRLAELQHHVLRDPVLFSTLLHDLSVGVTAMFRDPPFFRAFREHAVPLLRTYPLLKIWHAGCSTGEEAYATAILLSEAGLYDRVQLYATDLSSHAIEVAKQGVYPLDRLAAFEESYVAAGGAGPFSQYYTAAYNGFVMNEALRRKILFFQHNLVSDHVFGEMNAIFCRNVFIYFGAELRTCVLQKLTGSLCAGGFLCLGSSEQLTTADRKHSFEEVASRQPIYRCIAIS
jgi:chemotaxis protein methyltransferase CheR